MLRQGNPADFKKMLTKMQSEARSLLTSMVSLSYFMRGAITYEDMFWRTYSERQLIKEFLDERFEIEKNNPHPVY